jgi:hypothetical protein
MRKEYVIRNFNLQPMFDEAWALQAVFSCIIFKHVYRERNLEANGLSKDGLDLARGEWIIMEEQDGHSYVYSHATLFKSLFFIFIPWNLM